MSAKIRKYCKCGLTHQSKDDWKVYPALYVRSANLQNCIHHMLTECGKEVSSLLSESHPECPVEYCDCGETCQTAIREYGWDCQGLFDDIDDETYKVHYRKGTESSGIARVRYSGGISRQD